MSEGRTIQGRYRLGEKLGEGGYGAVYRAEHLAMGTPVALKLLHPTHGSDPRIAARFEQEARRSALLKHPHTISVFDFGTAEDGSLFLAMELLDGRSLTRELAGGPLAPARAVHVLEQILSALATAHRVGLVHRDLKPDNIFLVRVGDDADFVKVLDFGIAKALDASTEITASGTVIGTPAYMAPEQCQGLPVDARADLYALGCVAYHTLSGRAPFESDNTLGYLLAHVQRPPPPLPAEVPPGLASWVLQLLAKAPDDRFQSADLARAALATALTGEATWQYAIEPAAPSSLTHHAAVRDQQPTRTTGRRGLARWGLVGAALALAGGATWLATRPGGASGEPAKAPPSEVGDPASEALGDLESARAVTARLDAQAVLQAAELAMVNDGAVPASIDALVERGYLLHGKRLDPWGHAYRIEERAGAPRVCSLGRDGLPGKAGDPGDDICAQ